MRATGRRGSASPPGFMGSGLVAMRSCRILVGRIGAPHGVKGEVRLFSFTEEPLGIADYGTLAFEDGSRVRLLALKVQGKGLVARIEGVGDRSTAERLANRELFIEREELPQNASEDEIYHADLVGLEVRDEAGEPVGGVIAIHDFGAGDILEYRPPAGPTLFHPFTRAAVPQVDLAGGFLRIARQAEILDRESDGKEGGEGN